MERFYNQNGKLPLQGAGFCCWHSTQGAAALALGYA
jgi:hypothetical protein